MMGAVRMGLRRVLIGAEAVIGLALFPIFLVPTVLHEAAHIVAIRLCGGGVQRYRLVPHRSGVWLGRVQIEWWLPSSPPRFHVWLICLAPLALLVVGVAVASVSVIPGFFLVVAGIPSTTDVRGLYV